MGTGPSPPPGYDVLITDIGGRYLLETATNEGELLLKPLGLQEAGAEDFDAKLGLLESLKGHFKTYVDRAGIVDLVFNSQEHPVWKKYGSICLARRADPQPGVREA